MILVFGNEKGGGGKTTGAVNIASMLALAGHDVLLIDADQQETSSIWSAIRDESGRRPTIACMSKRGRIGFDIAKMKEKFDHIVIDTGGRDSLELRQAATVCDHLIIPVRASQFDTWSMDTMVALLQSVAKQTGYKPKASVLLNAVSTNPMVREADETRAVLMEDDYVDHFGVLQSMISDRIAFRRAAREGLGVLELSGNNIDPKASNEMQRLYKELFNESFHPKH